MLYCDIREVERLFSHFNSRGSDVKPLHDGVILPTTRACQHSFVRQLDRSKSRVLPAGLLGLFPKISVECCEVYSDGVPSNLLSQSRDELYDVRSNSCIALHRLLADRHPGCADSTRCCFFEAGRLARFLAIFDSYSQCYATIAHIHKLGDFFMEKERKH